MPCNLFVIVLKIREVASEKIYRKTHSTLIYCLLSFTLRQAVWACRADAAGKAGKYSSQFKGRYANIATISVNFSNISINIQIITKDIKVFSIHKSTCQVCLTTFKCLNFIFTTMNIYSIFWCLYNMIGLFWTEKKLIIFYGKLFVKGKQKNIKYFCESNLCKIFAIFA